MRIKTCLSTLTLATALISSSSLMSTSAMADKGTLLRPVSDWSVKKVDASSASGAGYCAIARQYNQDTILTVAKNSNAETSFALDFQRTRLDRQNIYYVVLDPGAGQKRAFEVRPVSGQAFVVRLGEDTGFFSALERTGTLRVEVGNQAYNFDVSNFDAGNRRLNGCVANMITPAAGGDDIIQPVPAPAVRPAPAIRSTSSDTGAASDFLRTQMTELRGQIESLKQQNRSLQHSLESAKNAQPSPVDSAAIAKLLDRVSGLERENEALSNRLAAASSIDTVSNSEMQALRDENIRLRADLKIREMQAGSNENVSMLAQEIAELRKENARLSRVADKAARDLGAEERALLIKLTEENRELQQRVRDYTEGRGDTSLLVARVSELEAENTALRRKMEEFAISGLEAERAQDTIAALKSENERLRIAVSEAAQDDGALIQARAELQSLRDKNAQLVADLQALENEVRSTYTVELDQIVSENQALKQALDAQSVDSQVLAQLRAQVERLQSENAALEKNAVMAGKAFEKEKATEIAALKTMYQQNSEARQVSLDMMQTKIDALNEQLHQKERQVLQSAGQSAELTALKAEKNALELEVASLRQESRMSDELRKKVAELEGLNQSLKTDLEIAERTQGKSDSQQLAALEQENARLREQLGKALGPDAAASASLQEELKTLRARNAELLASLSKKSGAADSASSELQAVIDENLRLKNQITLKDQEIVALAALGAELELMQLENERLNDDLDELRAGLDKAPDLAVLNELRQENSKLRVDLEAALAANTSAPADIAGAQAEIAAIQKDNARLAQELEMRAQKLVSLEAQLAEKDEVIAGLQRENKELTEELLEKAAPVPLASAAAGGATPQQVAEMATQISTLRAENTSLKGNLAKVRTELLNAEMALAAVDMSAVEPAAGDKTEPFNNSSVTDESAEGRPVSTNNGNTDDAVVDLLNAGVPAGAGVEPERQQPSMQLAEVSPAVVKESDFGLTEAQKLERQLDRELRSQTMEIPEPEISAPQEDISVSHSEDPFAAIKVEDHRSSDSIAIEEESLAAPSSMDAVPVIENSSPVARAAEPQDNAPLSLAGIYSPHFDVRNLLQSSQVAAAGSISTVKSISGPNKVAYQWKQDSVYGTAEQQNLLSREDFDERVKVYLERTQSRCNGDFAIVPDNTTENGGTRIDSYEVACVGPQAQSSASLLFFNKGDTFTVVAHEATTENMIEAMDKRDRLIKAIGGS